MYFLYKYEYGTLKPVGEGKCGKRENNGGNKPIWGIIHVYMEMLQRDSLPQFLLVKFTSYS
jgi:hypothetical protein